MVTALRSGPPQTPPIPPNRASEVAGLPEFARSLMSASRSSAPPKSEGSSPEPASTVISDSRPEPESDPSRPVRTPRPGSLVDIRV